MTPAPPPLDPTPPPTSSRAQHAERNVRLDPQGIYGTRSARRQSQLRRRRQLQNAILWAFGALATLALARWALQPRQSLRAVSQTLALPFRPAAPPLALSDGTLLFASQSGGLWNAKVLGDSSLSAPRRVWSTAFAPGAAPLVTPAQIFWPGGDGTLTALDLRTKMPRWSANLPSALVARPALVTVKGQNWLVAGDDSGHLAAFDAKSGALKWKKVLGGALGAGIGVLPASRAARAIRVNIPIVQATPTANVLASRASAGGLSTGGLSTGGLSTGGLSTGGLSTGVLSTTGKPAGRAKGASKIGAGVLVPLMAGPQSRGGLVCLDADTGAERWRFPGDARSQSAGMAAPVALGNRVFWCNDEGAVVCLEGATGRKIWKRFAAPLPSIGATASGAASDNLVMLRGAPTLVEAAGVVIVGGNDGAVRAFDLQTGAVRWMRDLGGAVRFAAQKLRLDGKNALLVTGETPAIWVLDAADGVVLRRWSTPYSNSYGLALTPRTAYGLGADGHLQFAPLG